MTNHYMPGALWTGYRTIQFVLSACYDEYASGMVGMAMDFDGRVSCNNFFVESNITLKIYDDEIQLA